MINNLDELTKEQLIQEFNNEVSKRKEVIEGRDRLKERLRTLEAQNQTLLDETSQLKAKVDSFQGKRKVFLRRDIEHFAAKYNAINSSQVWNLLESRVKFDEDKDAFYFPVYSDSGEETARVQVEAYIKEFLSLQENFNLTTISQRRGLDTRHQRNDVVQRTSDSMPKSTAFKKFLESSGLSPKAARDLYKKNKSMVESEYGR